MQEPSNAVKKANFKHAAGARDETQEEEQHNNLESKNCSQLHRSFFLIWTPLVPWRHLEDSHYRANQLCCNECIWRSEIYFSNKTTSMLSDYSLTKYICRLQILNTFTLSVRRYKEIVNEPNKFHLGELNMTWKKEK